MKKTKNQLLATKIIGAAGALMLVAILPLSMMRARQAYSFTEEAPALQLLAPSEVLDSSTVPHELNDPWTGGAFLVQVITIDPFTRSPHKTWSRVLKWPAVSNQVQQVHFEGQSDDEQITFTIVEMKWGRERWPDDVPHWQRKEMDLRSGTIRAFSGKRSNIIRTSIAGEYHTRNRHSKTSRSFDSGEFEHMYNLSAWRQNSVIAKHARSGVNFMLAVTPLADASATKTVGVETYLPTLNTLLDESEADESDYLHSIGRVGGAEVPHGFKMFGAKYTFSLMGFIGVMWACGLFRNPALALGALFVGLIFYLGVVDRMETSYHLKKLESVEASPAVRVVAAAMSSQSFFHLGDVDARLNVQHDSWIAENPRLADALLAESELAGKMSYNPKLDYADSQLLRAALRLEEPTVHQRLTDWAATSPLRDFYQGRYDGGFHERVQVMTCTTNRIAFAQLSNNQLFPMRRADLPEGIVLTGMDLGAERVELRFELSDQLAEIVGQESGREYVAKLKLSELIGFENDDHNRMVFSSRDQREPILDYVNSAFLLQRAGVDCVEISPVLREVMAQREDLPYRLKLRVPYNYRVTEPTRDAGEVHVYRLTDQEPRINVHLEMYIGNEPPYPFNRTPRESVEVQGVYTWQQFTRGSGKSETIHLKTKHQPAGDRPPIYMEVSGASEAERAAMQKIAETLQVLPRG